MHVMVKRNEMDESPWTQKYLELYQINRKKTAVAPKLSTYTQKQTDFFIYAQKCVYN